MFLVFAVFEVEGSLYCDVVFILGVVKFYPLPGMFVDSDQGPYGSTYLDSP